MEIEKMATGEIREWIEKVPEGEDILPGMRRMEGGLDEEIERLVEQIGRMRLPEILRGEVRFRPEEEPKKGGKRYGAGCT